MFNKVSESMEKDLKLIKRKYRILKFKWILTFVLPILIIVLAYQVSKEFLKLRLKEIGSKHEA